MTQKILKAIDDLANMACNPGYSGESAVKYANAADQLANAYVKIKDIELHENYHLQLPGEGNPKPNFQ
jgi:hypothetical protein